MGDAVISAVTGCFPARRWTSITPSTKPGTEVWPTRLAIDVTVPDVNTSASREIGDERGTSRRRAPQPRCNLERFKGHTVEIPVPSKDQIMGDFEKIATTKPGSDEDDES